MGKKATSKKGDSVLTSEEQSIESESRRLRQRTLATGVLATVKASVQVPLRPTKQILKCDGRDIVKKGQRKTKYLFAFPGLIAPVSGGRLGELTSLDTRNPILYIEFPQGCLKLFGTITYPTSKYLTLNLPKGTGNIVCEDTFESMVVFSDAWWVGTKEGNPDEFKLELPEELTKTKLHKEFDFSGGAGRPNTNSSLGGIKSFFQSKPSNLKENLQTFEENDKNISDENFEEENSEGIDSNRPRRQSERTAGKKFRFVEDGIDSEEEEGEEGEEGDEGEDGEEREDSVDHVDENSDEKPVKMVPSGNPKEDGVEAVASGSAKSRLKQGNLMSMFKKE